jgi:hypothetical protein
LEIGIDRISCPYEFESECRHDRFPLIRLSCPCLRPGAARSPGPTASRVPRVVAPERPGARWRSPSKEP